MSGYTSPRERRAEHAPDPARRDQDARVLRIQARLEQQFPELSSDQIRRVMSGGRVGDDEPA